MSLLRTQAVCIIFGYFTSQPSLVSYDLHLRIALVYLLVRVPETTNIISLSVQCSLRLIYFPQSNSIQKDAEEGKPSFRASVEVEKLNGSTTCSTHHCVDNLSAISNNFEGTSCSKIFTTHIIILNFLIL